MYTLLEKLIFVPYTMPASFSLFWWKWVPVSGAVWVVMMCNTSESHVSDLMGHLYSVGWENMAGVFSETWNYHIHNGLREWLCGMVSWLTWVVRCAHMVYWKTRVFMALKWGSCHAGYLIIIWSIDGSRSMGLWCLVTIKQVMVVIFLFH